MKEDNKKNTISLATLGHGNVIIDDIVVVEEDYFNEVQEKVNLIISERGYYVATNRNPFINIAGKDLARKSDEYYIDFDKDFERGKIGIENFHLNNLVHNNQRILTTDEEFTGDSGVIIPIEVEDVSQLKDFMVYMDMLFIINGGDSAEIQISKDKSNWRTIAKTSWDTGGDLHPMKVDIKKYLADSTTNYLKFKMHDGSPNDANHLTNIWFDWSYIDTGEAHGYTYGKNFFHQDGSWNMDDEDSIVSGALVDQELYFEKHSPASYDVFINDKETPDKFFLTFKSTYSPYWAVGGDFKVVEHFYGDYFNNTFLVEKINNEKEQGDLILSVYYLPDSMYKITIVFSIFVLLVSSGVYIFMFVVDYKRRGQDNKAKLKL